MSLANRLAFINNQIRQMDEKLGIEEEQPVKRDVKQNKRKGKKNSQVRGDSLNRVQLLYDNGINQIRSREEMQKENADRRAQQEMGACTFTPEINPRSRSYSANCRPLLERSQEVLRKKTQRIIDHE